ncbi:MAG: CoA transferase, partial [Porticoccaceae bacterium]
AARADILLHNYRPGVMDRIGLGSEVLRQLNPQLIYVAVSGFGTEGPMADLPAFDHVIQGMSGLTDLQE